MNENFDVKNKSKKTGTYIFTFIFLLIILFLFLAYKAGFFSVKINNTTSSNESVVNTTDNIYIDPPTDMVEVSKTMNQYLSYFIKQVGVSKLDTNLLEDSNYRIDLVNSLFLENNNCSWTDANSNGKTYQDFPYVPLATYKDGYETVFGDLKQFETDKSNSSLFMAKTIDSTMDDDLIGLTKKVDSPIYSVNISANEVSYDEINKKVTIDGVIHYINVNTGTFEFTKKISLVYSNNGMQNYIISIIIQ